MMPLLHLPHVTITGLPRGLSAHPTVVTVELVLFAYFFAVNTIDFTLIAVSMRHLSQFVRLERADTLRRVAMPFAAPVSVLLPAHNEEEHIVGVVRSLLRMRYPEYEIIVINDGSTDRTLDRLKEEFGLVPVPSARLVRFSTEPVRQAYRSTAFPRLRVIDKENGGKGDALNAGINESQYPMLLTGDGDSLYAEDALEQMMQPFLEDARTVACGAALRILNGAEVIGGVPVQRELPRSLIVRFQVLEYLRAALTSRFGWAPLNGLMSISGACGLWRKEIVVAAGGFAANTIWEDMEMTVRVHHYMRAQRRPYRVAFVPEGVCWTKVPETLAELRDQRIGWQRHITETIHGHRNLLFRPFSGVAGWFALPAIVLTEWLAPLWLLLGLAFLVVAGWLGILSVEAQLALLAMVFALTILKMAAAFLLDEVSYRTYRLHDIWSLFLASMLEQLGFRQLIALWNAVGIVKFYARRPIRGRTAGIASWRDRPYRPR